MSTVRRTLQHQPSTHKRSRTARRHVVNGKAHGNTKTLLDDLILLLGRIAVLQDPHTQGHSDHVTEYGAKLATHIHLPLNRMRFLRYAATLHDIGKIGINEFIINKPTKLTEAEYHMVQQHTLLGHKVIQPLKLDPVIASVILSHHENYDGTGYPNGLKGKAIPLEARIVRIVDVYDALTSARPYREAYSPMRALEIIKAEARFYDPVLLSAFMEVVAEQPIPA